VRCAETAHGDVSERANENRKLDQSRDLGAPRMHADSSAVEHLQQRDTLNRVAGDRNDHHRGKDGRVAPVP